MKCLNNQRFSVVFSLNNFQQTTLDEICKNAYNEKGLLDILTQANEELQYSYQNNQSSLRRQIKNIESLKPKPADALYDVMDKMSEVYLDNLQLRLKVNDKCN